MAQDLSAQLEEMRKKRRAQLDRILASSGQAAMAGMPGLNTQLPQAPGSQLPSIIGAAEALGAGVAASGLSAGATAAAAGGGAGSGIAALLALL